MIRFRNINRLTCAGLCLLAACVAGGAGADEAPALKLDADACVRMAVERAATARNARTDMDISVEEKSQARSLILPSLSSYASYKRLDEVESFTLDGEEVELGTLDNYAAGVKVSQLLYAGGKAGAAIRAAGLEGRRAHWALVGAYADLARDVRVAFAGLLLAAEETAVREQSVARYEAVLKQTEDKQARGMASEFDVLTARVRLANEHPRLVAARNRQSLSAEDFRRLIGLTEAPLEPRGRLAFEPWDADLEALTTRALAARPDLNALRATAALREQDVAAARSARLPEVRAEASYNGANSYGFASFSDEWQWHWNAGVTANWNIWDGDLTRATVRSKRLELAKALTTLEDVERAAALDVRKAFLDMMHARETVEAGRNNVELAERAATIAAERYGAGLSTYLDVVEAGVALDEARLTHAGAMHDHTAAAARLRHACGIPDPEAREGN